MTQPPLFPNAFKCYERPLAFLVGIVYNSIIVKYNIFLLCPFPRSPNILYSEKKRGGNKDEAVTQKK